LQANQAHRKAIKEKEQAISRAAATKKASGVAEQDKLAATKDAEDKEMAAKQLVQLVKVRLPSPPRPRPAAFWLASGAERVAPMHHHRRSRRSSTG
jgi:hypothetical protein